MSNKITDSNRPPSPSASTETDNQAFFKLAKLISTYTGSLAGRVTRKTHETTFTNRAALSLFNFVARTKKLLPETVSIVPTTNTADKSSAVFDKTIE
jgi:hypothetical protein